MSYIVPKEIPNCCGRCPCFHAEHPMYCQAVIADKNKRIYAPYGEGRPDWCPLVEVKTPHGELVDKNGLMDIYADRLTAVAERYSPDSSECGILSGAMKLLAIQPTVIEAEE